MPSSTALGLFLAHSRYREQIAQGHVRHSTATSPTVPTSGGNHSGRGV